MEREREKKSETRRDKMQGEQRLPFASHCTVVAAAADVVCLDSPSLSVPSLVSLCSAVFKKQKKTTAAEPMFSVSNDDTQGPEFDTRRKTQTDKIVGKLSDSGSFHWLRVLRKLS